MPVGERTGLRTGLRAELTAPLRLLRTGHPSTYAVGLLAAVLLAVPDLGRQLLVRDDPSRWHALLVDVVGFASATVVQVALVGAATGAPGRRWLSAGTTRLLALVRARPLLVLAGLVCAGAVSAVLTVPASVAVLGVGQVVGPLHDPALWRLGVAQLSDLVATAVTAPYFAVLVATSRSAREDGPHRD